jgi:cell shape-determining protein MreD
MRSAAILLATFFLLALLSPLLEDAGVAHYVPDFALVICLYVGLTTPPEKAIFLALVIGGLRDGFTMGQAIGLSMEVSVMAVILAGRLSRRLVLRGPVGAMLFALVASLLASIVELILSLLFVRNFTEGTSGPELILRAMLPQALVTAPFGAILFWLFDRLDALTTRKNESVFL